MTSKHAPESSPDVRSQSQRWHEFLEMAITISHASGGAIWTGNGERPPVVLTQHLIGSQPLDDVHSQWPGHVDILQAVFRTSETKVLAAEFQQQGAVQQLQLLLLPIVSTAHSRLVLELFLPQHDIHPLDQVEESLRRLISWAAPTDTGLGGTAVVEFADLLAHVHRTLSLDETCFAITNETRLWSNWDRVSILLHEGGRWTVKSVSGVDVLDPRSTTVTTLEHAAAGISLEQLPVVSTYAESQPGFENYHARTNVQRVAVCSLMGCAGSAEQRLLGLLVVDLFEQHDSPVRSVDELQLASHHLATALAHALSFHYANENLIQRTRRMLLSTRYAGRGLVLGVAVAVIIFLATFPVALTITGTGYLEPRQFQDVFAGTNGFIDQLHVAPGATVKQGDQLMTLNSPDLRFEMNRLNGELLTVRQQVSDLEKLRTDPRRASERGQSAIELAARGEELKSVESSLQQQLDLLQLQADELVLRSPIEGTITTWNLKTLLTENRPVTRTDRLLTIADLAGPWQARFYIDHRDMGPVLKALEAQQTSTSFVISEAPDSPQHARIFDVSPLVTTDAVHGTTLEFKAEIDKESLPNARPGTAAIFRVECGDAAIGYVWFRRLIDRIQGWWNLM